MRLNFLPYLFYADGTTLNSGAGGDVIHTDDIAILNGSVFSGQKTQVVKLATGVDGTTTYVNQQNPVHVTTNTKALYRAATSALLIPAVTVNVPFFVISGSATKTVSIQSILVSGATLTAIAYLNWGLARYSTAPTGGTATTLVKMPMDSTFAASTVSLCQGYTAVPTSGTKTGDISARRNLGQATTAAAAGIPEEIMFNFSDNKEGGTAVLNGVAQNIGLYWQVAPATTVSLLLRVEWCEY